MVFGVEKLSSVLTPLRKGIFSDFKDSIISFLTWNKRHKNRCKTEVEQKNC